MFLKGDFLFRCLAGRNWLCVDEPCSDCRLSEISSLVPCHVSCHLSRSLLFFASFNFCWNLTDMPSLLLIFLLFTLAGCNSENNNISFLRLSMRDVNGDAVEGYWAQNEASSQGCEVDWPCSSAWPSAVVKSDFVHRLRLLQHWLYPMARIFMGESMCRLYHLHACRNVSLINCGEIYVGNAEYIDRYACWDDVRRVRWPSGFLHYIELHDVLPSKQFYQYLMQRTRSPDDFLMMTNGLCFPSYSPWTCSCAGGLTRSIMPQQSADKFTGQPLLIAPSASSKSQRLFGITQPLQCYCQALEALAVSAS